MFDFCSSWENVRVLENGHVSLYRHAGDYAGIFCARLVSAAVRTV